ncbi:hypothetical protein Pint_19495 [Pistacia integerrima]|uniref:Uncharacterized protein n=1 Tax=Pistacia integerrima TaxID=434235 RepID=A0ACC0YZ81_9ROSI|nr:hypothetical protein Pint_19495 [Pistacia integerrima]
MVLPLFSENGLLSRLTSIFLGFAPSFLLLSIGYEAVFYSALALVLMSWILFENALLHSSAVKNLSPYTRNMEEHMILQNDNRYLQLSDIRIPLTFVINEHAHDTPTPKEWGLDGIERSTLLGLPCSFNSIGNLPLEYIKMNEESAVDFIGK